jgi:hypothetical protein
MQVQVINFPKISDHRGSLTFMEYPKNLPFEIKYSLIDSEANNPFIGRIYTSMTINEVIISLSGRISVTIILPAGDIVKYSLTEPNIGLLVPKCILRKIENESDNIIILKLLDTDFSITEYSFQS